MVTDVDIQGIVTGRICHRVKEEIINGTVVKEIRDGHMKRTDYTLELDGR
jgi:hypothetical protein